MGLGENLLLKNKTVSSQVYIEDLQKIVAEINDLTKEVQIILFGSVATQNATTYSDVDLAIIFKNNICKADFKKKYYSLKRHLPYSIDLIFLTIDQMQNSIENPIVQVLEQDGIELFPKWTFFPLPFPKEK